MRQSDDSVPGHVERSHPAIDDDAPESSNAMPRNRIVDQVARRMTFSDAHPEVVIAFQRTTGRWEATYPAGKNGTEAVYGLDLRDLLDKLGKRFG